MGNLWPYKNHNYRTKYLIVLLQAHCEKIQFKSGHPVALKGIFRLVLHTLRSAIIVG